MLKSCKYCGRIHDSKFICNQKPQRKKYNTEADRFRWTSSWKNKREEIKQRDLYLCQICIRELYNTMTKYNTNNLEVHHNIPINENYDKRLDNYNLITVCHYHHELCESGEIPREEIQVIINEQEDKMKYKDITIEQAEMLQDNQIDMICNADRQEIILGNELGQFINDFRDALLNVFNVAIECIQEVTKAIQKIFNSTKEYAIKKLNKKISKKRFIKLLQSKGIQRNDINKLIKNNKDKYTMWRYVLSVPPDL